MKITLRKADALQKVINGVLAETTLQTTATITRFNSARETIAAAQDKLSKDLVKKVDLIWALYDLRKMVSAAGATAGVSNALAEIAAIDKTVAVFKPITQAESYVGADGIYAQQADLIDDKTVSNYSGRRESITVSIVPKGVIEEHVKSLEDLRKMRLKLSDHLLEINVRTEFDLSYRLEKILRDNGII